VQLLLKHPKVVSVIWFSHQRYADFRRKLPNALGYEALISATARGHVAIVELLLQDARVRSEDALMHLQRAYGIALVRDRADIAKLIWDAKAEVLSQMASSM